ncbi:15-hydroxyprostaglandin dehydrogenase [NAD+] [Papilio machaon]|uniref:15-hydroxyprostaglandin dehydrogenase [NAD(+)] n=1 Tax=Papilio machaon TaxID=76193 RepID=A0A0N1PH34_PAPMA|nr:15-hydroxyprostaglandin dehydrogenase [NAD+] [Papilio machaon]
MVRWDVKGKSLFLKAGLKQVAILDIAEDVGKAFTADLNKTYPGKVIFVKCDVGNEECITAAFNEVVAKFKTVDIVFNNAGIMNDAPHIWRKMCDVNVQGLISFTYKAIKHMRTDEGGAGGTVINIASTGAITKHDVLPAYCATKSAVLQFSQCIAGNLFEQAGIRILTLCPGPTDTPYKPYMTKIYIKLYFTKIIRKVATLTGGTLFEQAGIRILTLCPGPTDTPLLHDLKKKGSDEKAGERLDNFLSHPMIKQSVDSAVNAMLKMYEEGENGSIWLTTDNKPVKNITPVVDAAFNSFMDAIMK